MKTAELTDAALDWAVAKCLPDDTLAVYFDEDTGEPLCRDDWPDNQEFKPSTDWAQGGPIIEREGMSLHKEDVHEWRAVMWWDDENSAAEIQMTGPTPLIAAMRCFVASKLGDNIDIPEELNV
jgi:hypothetical protein